MSKASPLGMDFPICRIFGVQIRADITLVIIGGLYAYSFGGIKMGLIAFVMIFGSVLMHEFGHIFATRAVGGHSDMVVLWPFGGLAYTWVPPRPLANFIVTVCGPLVNLILLALGYGIAYAGLVSGAESLELLEFFIWINFLLMVFNLIPAFPMDGGRILQSILWPILGYRRSLMVSSMIGITVAVAVAVFWGLLRQNYLLMLMMLWLASYAWQIYKSAKSNGGEPG
ncbi:site-2 protease family protein [Kamptonema cortianum]|uniref:Site-2 protease family protein n=1 Tax=Geitlerinema calcuttense NRMC-F 0142 TaxID=2922238 RepID=A0ABT7LX67_9CYAN|nr:MULTISPECIES: site-2 protease family protein [Cyanophyceae]MDK3156651.1 site-2 protease family protein [Kamptonema cortianum]MDL5050340.1 site-2 protease family protein [Oscillatoria amoena NRMC-F 0135]MDL5053389.1 site-2 protease family protein [Oscillatoria laete-virens NRMC-F 0139]MDL5056605.1 site-2 protease family protein [Geitlerinema calcuttense NRMC-F 0142]